ncbi:dTDP-4-dehydrorhamnose reductase [Candidatus Latescibacterota bacterium]
MKVLITGITGRVGRSLLAYKPENIDIELLLEPGAEKMPGYAWYRSDITDHDKTVMAVTCADPDVVIHLAAMTNVDKCEEGPEKAHNINCIGTENIAKSCSECGAKLVYLSTDYVFDGVSGPYSETDTPNPINVYGQSKFDGEKTVYMENSYNPLIVRISIPFGERIGDSGDNYYSWLAERLRQNNTVRIVDDQFTTPAYFGELAHVLWSLVKKDIGGIIHYGTSDRLSRHKMALEICEVMGFSAENIQPVKTSDLKFKAKRPLESGFDTSKVSEILDMHPISFKEALKKIAEAPKNKV